MHALGVGVIRFVFMGKVHAHDCRSVPVYYDPLPLGIKLAGVVDLAQERAPSTGKRSQPSLQSGLRLQRLVAAAERSAFAQTWQPFPGYPSRV